MWNSIGRLGWETADGGGRNFGDNGADCGGAEPHLWVRRGVALEVSHDHGVILVERQCRRRRWGRCGGSGAGGGGSGGGAGGGWWCWRCDVPGFTNVMALVSRLGRLARQHSVAAQRGWIETEYAVAAQRWLRRWIEQEPPGRIVVDDGIAGDREAGAGVAAPSSP